MDSVRQTFANVFGVLGMVSLLCVAVGAIIMVAGIPLEYVAGDRTGVVRCWGTCLLDGSLIAAILFGWLSHRVGKKLQEFLQVK
jgi:hypothetical protein